jgi:hypothetical protein
MYRINKKERDKRRLKNTQRTNRNRAGPVQEGTTVQVGDVKLSYSQHPRAGRLKKEPRQSSGSCSRFQVADPSIRLGPNFNGGGDGGSGSSSSKSSWDSGQDDSSQGEERKRPAVPPHQYRESMAELVTAA